MKDVNIIIGRFQPFTLGHLKCCEHAKKIKNVSSVICMIETKNADSRHPFLSTILAPMLKRLPSDLVEDVILVKNADIVKISEELHSKGYNPISWTCGTDRIETYTRQATRYGEKAGLSSDFEVLEVPRSDEDISATKVREALKSGDKRTFEKMMPRELHRFFDELSDAIKSVTESLKPLSVFLLEYLNRDSIRSKYTDTIYYRTKDYVYCCITDIDVLRNKEFLKVANRMKISHALENLSIKYGLINMKYSAATKTWSVETISSNDIDNILINDAEPKSIKRSDKFDIEEFRRNYIYWFNF